MNGDELNKAVIRTVEALEEAGVDYTFFGGFALAIYGRIRATKDADIMIFADEIKIEKIKKAMHKRGFIHHDVVNNIKLTDFGIYRFWNSVEELGISIKLDVVAASGEYHEQIFSRRIIGKVSGKEIFFVGCEDLIILKLIAGRLIDLADAQELLREKKNELDFEYINLWAERSGVKDRLDNIL